MSVVRRIYYVFVYYLSWLWFGAGGLTLNVASAFLLLLPRRKRPGRAVRKATQWLFSWWLKWIHASGVVRVTWKGFEQASLPAGTVYVANHPTLVDAPFLLSVLPNTICIFKPSLLRNPVIGPAAILSEYASGDAGVDLIRDVVEKLGRGCSLLIFPEGTRTSPGETLGPLKPGFALIALRAQAPIRLIKVRASPGLVARGIPWWRLPPLPAFFELTLGDLIEPGTFTSPQELAAHVKDRLASLIEDTSASEGSCRPPERISS